MGIINGILDTIYHSILSASLVCALGSDFFKVKKMGIRLDNSIPTELHMRLSCSECFASSQYYDDRQEGDTNKLREVEKQYRKDLSNYECGRTACRVRDTQHCSSCGQIEVCKACMSLEQCHACYELLLSTQYLKKNASDSGPVVDLPADVADQILLCHYLNREQVFTVAQLGAVCDKADQQFLLASSSALSSFIKGFKTHTDKLCDLEKQIEVAKSDLRAMCTSTEKAAFDENKLEA